MKSRLEMQRRDITRHATGALREELEENWHATRGPSTYDFKEGTLHPASEKELTERLCTQTGGIRFLDAGAGEGKAREKAEQLDSKRVQAWGLSLGAPKEGQHASRWIQERVEQVVFPGQFHVIQSYQRGAVHWATNHAIALENLLNSLQTRGVLILPLGELKRQVEPIRTGMNQQFLTMYERANDALKHELELQEPVLAWRRLFQTLQRQGFKVNLEPDPAGHRPTPLLPQVIRIERGMANADLKEFYRHPAINRHPIEPRHVG